MMRKRRKGKQKIKTESELNRSEQRGGMVYEGRRDFVWKAVFHFSFDRRRFDDHSFQIPSNSLLFFRHLIYIIYKKPREIVLEKNVITSEINRSILIPIRDPNEIVVKIYIYIYLYFRKTIFSNKIKQRRTRNWISIRRRILSSIRFDVKKKKNDLLQDSSRSVPPAEETSVHLN